MELQEQLRKISPADGYYMEMAKERWRTVAKPLHSLGKLEDAVRWPSRFTVWESWKTR